MEPFVPDFISRGIYIFFKKYKAIMYCKFKKYKAIMYCKFKKYKAMCVGVNITDLGKKLYYFQVLHLHA